jgi:uncharacterized protein (DUF924 family)
MASPRARAILDYWFGDLDHSAEYFAHRNALWFNGGERVDREIREKFGTDLLRAVEGKLDAWKETPRGSLALIVLLDQFSLNIHREKPRSYEQSAMAIPVARRMLERGWNWTLTPVERVFVYLPFEHSEDLADQERSVALFDALAAEAPSSQREAMDGYLNYARRHYRVMKRFGRFPDRNEVFHRPSTPEEISFLNSNEAPF